MDQQQIQQSQPQLDSEESKEVADASQQSQQPSYKQKEYWNERYAVKETKYDWYCGYPELKALFSDCYNLRKDAAILMVGCGNSKLSEDMIADGYSNILSTDISDVVIAQLAKIEQPGMRFEVQDCTNLTYADQTFDFVFDKGTLDALSCDVGSDAVSKMLSEMMRVCRNDGAICIVSFGKQEERKATFANSLGFEGYEYELCEKYLSVESQLTNIMRNVSNGLPMQLVMKNKNLLVKTMVEFAKIKKFLVNEKVESRLIDWDEVGGNQFQQLQQEEEEESNSNPINEDSQKQSTNECSNQDGNDEDDNKDNENEAESPSNSNEGSSPRFRR